MKGSRDYLDKQKRLSNPGNICVVIGVTEATGTNLYTVEVATLASGTVPMTYTESEVTVEGGEFMQMTDGSESGPSGWGSLSESQDTQTPGNESQNQTTRSASGSLTKGSSSEFDFVGEIDVFRTTGNITARIDGTEINPADYPSEATSATPPNDPPPETEGDTRRLVLAETTPENEEITEDSTFNVRSTGSMTKVNEQQPPS